MPHFQIDTTWHLGHLVDYLNSWSAVQHYIRKNDSNPVEEIYPEFAAAWGLAESYPVIFPLHIRVGRVNI